MSTPTTRDDGGELALLELLEFVDSWTPGASPPPQLEESTNFSATRSNESEPATSGRRKRSREVDARRRLKKKRERVELKRGVEELTERLKWLQQGQRPKGEIPGWTTAEADNMALRNRLAINDTVISVLQDALSMELVGVTLDVPVTAQTIEFLRATLREMLATNNSVFEKFPPLLGSPFLLRCDFRVDGAGCPRVELSSAVEVDRNLAQVSKLLRSELKGTPPFWGTVSSCIERDGKTAEGVYALGDRVLDFQNSGLRSVGLVQKHQQREDCLDVVWALKIFHPTAGVSIISRTRLRISAVSRSRTLIQVFTELLAISDSSEVSTASPSQKQSVWNVLVRAFGDRLAAKHRVILKILLLATGKDDVASLVA